MIAANVLNKQPRTAYRE